MTKKKKVTRRSRVKYPALTKGYNSRIRSEYLDMDYIDKLSESEKEFLNKFSEEWVNASFKKTPNGNYSRKNLHTTKAQRKECYDRNNARNRCTHSIARATGLKVNSDYSQIHELVESKGINNPDFMEDALIDFIDSKNEKKD